MHEKIRGIQTVITDSVPILYNHHLFQLKLHSAMLPIISMRRVTTISRSSTHSGCKFVGGERVVSCVPQRVNELSRGLSVRTSKMSMNNYLVDVICYIIANCIYNRYLLICIIIHIDTRGV